MSAIDTLFRELRSRKQKAFMPFVTAGDPDVQFTADVLRTFANNGSHLAEVGIPYSDPIADGPVIQDSYTRALSGGVTLQGTLEMLHRISSEVTMPVVTMVSYAIVYRRGLEAYVDAAQAAGVSGAIVPDLLVEEAGPLAKICRERDFSLIQLVTPTTSRERALLIAEQSSGFLYYVSVTGITGERTKLPPELVDNVGWLRQQTSLPICIGFGISRPDHVRTLAPVADGLIVGSALVRPIAKIDEIGREGVLREIGEAVKALATALND